ncbi:MAG: indole-3-glycerol phosphate synthase TrpC, partial [Brevinematales bacterium]
MSKLEEIISNKRGEIPGLKEALSGGRYPSLKKYSGPSFLESLKNTPDFALIAEVKRKSPSQGSMAGGENPVEIARIFDEAGVNAISVLTDRKYFDGDFSILRDISSSVKAPLLCKDFIIDRVQVDMALASGAAAVLLITEALDDASLESLYNYTLSLGLDALVEAHFSR